MNYDTQMTLQSSVASLEEVDPSNTPSTSTSEVAFPLGFNDQLTVKPDGYEELDVLALASEHPGGKFILGSPNSKIGSDVNVHIEGNAQFIVNNHSNSLGLPFENGQCKEDYHTANLKVHKFQSRLRYVYLPTTLVLLILVSIAFCLIIFREQLFTTQVTFPSTNPNTSTYILDHPVYNRSNWGALDEREPPPLVPLPTELVIISHTMTNTCTNFVECANVTQQIQYEFIKQGHRDIGYNFLIGGEGGIYVGRGWDRQNSIRAKSVAVALIGNFDIQFVTNEQVNASKALLEEGLNIGALQNDYKLVGENQTSPLRFYSPGWNLAGEIRKWGHYFNGTVL